MGHRFEYSDRYNDEVYEYRHVVLPKEYTRRIPTHRLMRESEWRHLGVRQSEGWMHYAIHKPERHILLFKRPKDFQNLSKTEQMKWDRQKHLIQSETNAELGRVDAPRTRNHMRQALKEMNAGASKSQPDPYYMMGANPDLFY